MESQHIDKLVLLLTRFVESKEEETRNKQKDHIFNKWKWMVIAVFFVGGYLATFIISTYIINKEDGPHAYAAIVRIQGVISAEQRTNYLALSEALVGAFKDEEAKGVVLLINSPGGSAAQSQLIYERIKFLAKKHDKRVIVVAEDLLTSGAYMIAMAGEKVYAISSSIVGSIGVKMESLAWNKIADKYGVEQRVYQAGDKKTRFSPFKPASKDDEQKALEVLNNMHDIFIELVKESRGERLMAGASKENVFNGDFWNASDAEKMGLIDGQLDLFAALEKEFGVTEIQEHKPRIGLDALLKMMGK